MNAVEQLKAEIDRLQKAVDILEGGSSRRGKGRGKISAERRAKLSKALKASWKKRKAAKAA